VFVINEMMQKVRLISVGSHISLPNILNPEIRRCTPSFSPYGLLLEFDILEMAMTIPSEENMR
jgi:hypothetical protein